MPNFCLMPQAVDNFLSKIRDGTLDPARLADMTSAQRREIFSGIVGKNSAQEVNALFESKLLLKNQNAGMVSWAQKVAGMKPEVRRDIISRIEKLDRVLDPEEQTRFLHDLASTRLGVDVTQAEAKAIADMSKKVAQTKSLQRPDGTFPSEEARLNYGRSKVALGNYVSDLKLAAEKPSLATLATHPARAATHAAGFTKSIKASLDNSALLRQGWKTMFNNPVIWQKHARQSFVDIVRQLGNRPVMDEIHADIVSRPNYEKYQKMRLATSNIEEAFPSHAPEKIPGFGRLFKASETAYTGFLYRTRADVADKYLEIAQKNGVNLNDKKELESLGKLINSLTGRGHLGGLEPAANTVNNWFFSPRSLKSNIDTLTAHQFQKGVTPFVRKEAAKATIKIVVGTAAVMAIAEALLPGSVEFDPRSADFGKIKVGHTRFDISGGMSSVATLAARLVTQSSKSSSTGKINKLNSGYGSDNGSDVISNFLQNKLSPAAAVVNDLIRQQDSSGNKPTVKGEATNALIPLPITNIGELRSDPDSANTLVAGLADALGVVTNTYGKSDKNWNTNPTKAQQEFKSKVGDQAYEQANKDYNAWVDQWTSDNAEALAKLPPEDRQSVVSGAKDKIQKAIMKKKGYVYKAAKQDKQAAKTKKGLLKTIK